MKSKLVVNNFDLSDKVVQATREKISISVDGGKHIPVFTEEQVTPEVDVNVTSEVEFDTYISWVIQSPQPPTPSWSTTLDGVLYSNGTPQYADATQIGDNEIYVVYLVYASTSTTRTKVSKLVQFSPSLPEYFEIRGTLTVKCTDISGQSGHLVGSTTLFVGFCDNGDFYSTDNHIGIAVVADNSYSAIKAIGFGDSEDFNDSEYRVTYYQPTDKTISFLIRKTSGGWYAEFTDGNTTKSVSGSGTIDPEQFIVYYTEQQSSNGSGVVKMESDITIESITQL